MRKLFALVFIAAVTCSSSSAKDTPAENVRRVVSQFQQALEKRDVASIERLVANDVVVLENGHRNDGWLDFRDNHLIPEMKEPAPPSKTELIKITATSSMGWAYTRTTMLLTRKNGEKADAELWSVYVVEKRAAQWKITLLDWSMRVQKPSITK